MSDRRALKAFPTATLSKKLIRILAQTNAHYGLIGEGDRVMLGLSGGKDSLTLTHLLISMQRIAPFDFELLAVTVDYGMGEDLSAVAAHCKAYGIPHHIEKSNIFQSAADHIRPNSSFCSYFSRMRRGVLYGAAKRLGFKTLALAHHMDDAAESFFMNLFYNGKMRAMPPVYRSAEHGLRVIRPLIKARERQMVAFVAENGFKPIGDEACPAMQLPVKMPHARAEMKAWLATLERDRPELFKQMAKGFENLHADSFFDGGFLEGGAKS